MTIEEKYVKSSIKSCEIFKLEEKVFEQCQHHRDIERSIALDGADKMASGDVENALLAQIAMRATSYLFALNLTEVLKIVMARIEPDDEVMVKVREMMRPKSKEMENANGE